MRHTHLVPLQVYTRQGKHPPCEALNIVSPSIDNLTDEISLCEGKYMTPHPLPPLQLLPHPSHHTHSLCILEKVWWRCNFGQLLGVVWGVVTSLRELSVERCHHFRPHPKAYLVMQSPPSHLGRTFCHPFCHLPVPICSCSEVTLVQDLQQH